MMATSGDAPRPHQPSRKRNTLVGKIRQQMEFYFGDANLDKDRFLGEKIKEDQDGFVPISVLLTFNKLRSLTTDELLVREAVRGSTFLELSENGSCVRRTQEFLDLGPADDRTLYVENLPPFCDHEWIKGKFSPFGKVLYVSLPRFKTTKTIKGFAFVEFDSPASVQGACEYFSNPSTSGATCFEKEAALPVEPSVTDKDFDEDELSAQHGKKRKREETDQESGSVTEAVPETAAKPEVKPLDLSKRFAPREKAKPISQSRKMLANFLPLKVMAKLTWMDLKKRYLDMQKESFKILKQKLKIMDVSDADPSSSVPNTHDHRQEAMESDEDDEMASTPSNSKPPPQSPKKPALLFTPGVIVQLTLKNPVSDRKKVVQELRVIPHVQFVDVTSDTEVYIRCDTMLGTVEVMEELGKRAEGGVVRLLEGNEEEAYWKKIQSGAKERGNVDRKRGKAKVRDQQHVIAKAEKKKEAAASANVHIKFQDMQ